MLSGRRLLAYQLILRKIITIIATRCPIFRLKCTKFDFGWGSTPDPAGGAYSAPPDPLAAFKGPTSKGEGVEGEKVEGKGGEGKGRGRKWEGVWAPNVHDRLTPLKNYHQKRHGQGQEVNFFKF